ncbi:hypothetical protein OAO01_07975 [Oligoflexia bacterium]|nr:hypothetical protein [Oligoflexia bacterium]
MSDSQDQCVLVQHFLAFGSEGLTFKGKLHGAGWGVAQENSVALKISLPFSVSRKELLPGLMNGSRDECSAGYAALFCQVPIVRELASKQGTKLAPQLMATHQLVSSGNEAHALLAIVTEFIEGPTLEEVMEDYKESDAKDPRRLTEALSATARYIYELFQHGICKLDASIGNFVLDELTSPGCATAICVDFGDAALSDDPRISSVEEERVETLDRLAREMHEMALLGESAEEATKESEGPAFEALRIILQSPQLYIAGEISYKVFLEQLAGHPLSAS